MSFKNPNCNIEYYFARYSGVAMAGIKPASLVRFPKGGGVNRLIRSLSGKGIRFRVLAGKKTKLILVYREAVLARHLALTENRGFLLAAGYPDGGADVMLEYLERRFKAEGFPHEVGIFLGYPPEDVRGFTLRPNACEYCGMWKVYGDVEQKKKLFAYYKNYTDSITARVTGGQSLAEIISY